MKALSSHRVGVVLDAAPCLHSTGSRVGIVGTDDELLERVEDLLDGSVGLVVECEPTLVAEVGGTRVRRTASLAGLGRLIGCPLTLVDVEAHHAGVLVADVVLEERDVPGDGLRPGLPTLPTLDVPGVHPLADEPPEVRLPEVRRRDGLADLGALRGALEHVQEHLVGDLVGVGEPAPQRIAVVARVVVEPPIDERHRGDQRDVPLPSLSVDGDGEAVLVRPDVAEGEVVEFPTTEPPVHLEGDRSRIARALRGVDHGLDVVLPLEHVVGVGCGVVVLRQRGGDPRDRLGWLLRIVRDAVVSGTPAEDPERDAVVLVGLGALLEVVGVVDPGDDLLGSVTIDERVGEIGGRVFGDADTVPEQLHVPVPAVDLPEELQSIAEVQEQLALGLVVDLTLGVPELLAKDADLALRIGHSLTSGVWLLNIRLKAHPWLSSYCLQATPETAPGRASAPVEKGAVTPHSAIASANGGVGA